MDAIIFPAGPFPPVNEPISAFAPAPVPPEIKIEKGTYAGKKFRLRMRPGEGIAASPFESEELLDLTFPMGQGSSMVYGILFQLGKWGYEVRKVSESISVSPVFTEYYQKTIEEKRRMEEQIKAGFASLSTAITDFELLAHDARKYKEYMGYFQAIEKLKMELKETKEKQKKDDLEKKLREANHVLRALFVDYVDAHAGEGIALRGIAPRWPTIISDFMELNDDEDAAEKITKRLEISRAEAMILATKNKLYLSWKELFYGTVKGRYERLLGLMKARGASVREYRDQMRPLLHRFKSITEAPIPRTLYFHRPDAQAVSIDSTEVWAWRPFVIPEIFKLPRETYETVTFQEAGFTKEEVKWLKNDFKAADRSPPKDIPALPALPIMDDFVRAIIGQAEQVYKVKLTMEDVYGAIQDLKTRYGPPYRPQAIKPGIRWPFSPYFIFVVMKIDRTVLKLPNGGTIEDIWIEPLKTQNSSQNVMLGRLLALKAKEKAEEREIAMLLGEQMTPEGGDWTKIMKVSEAVKEEFPEVFGEKPKEEKKKKEPPEILTNLKKGLREVGIRISDILNKIGLRTEFAYPGTYEKFMFERMTKMMQLGPGIAHITVSEYLKKAAGVPGASVRVWL